MIDGLRLGVELPAAPAGRSEKEGEVLPGLRACAQTLEASPAGSLWIDGGDPVAPAPDPCVLAGALATATSRVLVGVVDRLEGRMPAVLARDVTAVHLLSGGRAALLLCLPGVRGRPGPDPLRRLLEAAAVCRAVFSGELPAFAGEHFTLAGAPDRPPFPLAGRPPVVVALPDEIPDLGAAHQLAELAATVDAVAVGGGPERVAAVATALRSAAPGAPVLWRGTLDPDDVALAAGLREAGAEGLLVRSSGGVPVRGWASAVAGMLRPAVGRPTP